MRNVISISFVDAIVSNLSHGEPYEVCFISKNHSFSIIVTQTEDTKLLPENVETVIMKNQSFDIYPEGDFLVDLFECRGTATMSYGRNKKDLDDMK